MDTARKREINKQNSQANNSIDWKFLYFQWQAVGSWQSAGKGCPDGDQVTTAKRLV